MRKEYQELCRTLAVDKLADELLDQAFAHSSAINELNKPAYCSNERLEYLGDAVLELAVSEQLYLRLPKATEGELTRIRAELVCEENLAEKARVLKLGNLMQFGRGERLAGGAEKPALLADAMEALFGAIFLTHGFAAVSRVIDRLLIEGTDLRKLLDKSSHHWKTRLQEWVQQSGPARIEYLVKQEGSDHKPVFTATVVVDGRAIGVGSGGNKKEAEQAAARVGYERLAGRAGTKPKP